MVTATAAAAVLIIYLIGRDEPGKGKLTQLFKSPALQACFRYLPCGMNWR